MNEHERIIALIRAKNASLIPLEPRRTALIVVDMQRYFTQPLSPFMEVFNKLSPGAASAYLTRVRNVVIPSIQKLLACFRALSSPIVFTTVGTATGEGHDLPCWLREMDDLGLATLGSRIWLPINDPGWQSDEALTPHSGEPVASPFSVGAFATTGLEQRLRHQGVEAGVGTGVGSEVCVNTTAREAADHGFLTILVTDGCTGLSEQMHQASLDAFNIAFGGYERQRRSWHCCLTHRARPQLADAMVEADVRGSNPAEVQLKKRDGGKSW